MKRRSSISCQLLLLRCYRYRLFVNPIKTFQKTKVKTSRRGIFAEIKLVKSKTHLPFRFTIQCFGWIFTRETSIFPGSFGFCRGSLLNTYWGTVINLKCRSEIVNKNSGHEKSKKNYYVCNVCLLEYIFHHALANMKVGRFVDDLPI